MINGYPANLVPLLRIIAPLIDNQLRPLNQWGNPSVTIAIDYFDG